MEGLATLLLLGVLLVSGVASYVGSLAGSPSRILNTQLLLLLLIDLVGRD